jgi:hypothetical protein
MGLGLSTEIWYRVPNILVEDDGVFLIGFDWAGQQGAAKYPLHLNQDIEWHPEAGVGVNIEYAHDEHIMVKGVCS